MIDIETARQRAVEALERVRKLRRHYEGTGKQMVAMDIASITAPQLAKDLLQALEEIERLRSLLND